MNETIIFPFNPTSEARNQIWKKGKGSDVRYTPVLITDIHFIVLCRIWIARGKLCGQCEPSMHYCFFRPRMPVPKHEGKYYFHQLGEYYVEQDQCED